MSYVEPEHAEPNLIQRKYSHEIKYFLSVIFRRLEDLNESDSSALLEEYKSG